MADTDKDTSGKHSAWRIALIVCQVPILAFTMVINFLSAGSQVLVKGFYVSTTTNVSDKYETALTPAPWTFSIWTFIYIFQVLHVCYSLSLICRKSKDGDYLYISPGHIHFSFYIVFIINNCINVSWMLLWDREYIHVSFAFLCFNAFSLYTCGFLVCKYLHKAGAYLESNGSKKEIWLTRMIVLNGIAFYGTWVTPASLLNFASVLQYRGGVASATCAWISLVIVTVEIITWFVLETFVFDKYLRYCFSPYVVLLVAFAGILSKKYNPAAPEPYLIYLLVLTSAVVALGITKVIVMVVKGLKCPITYADNAADMREKDS